MTSCATGCGNESPAERSPLCEACEVLWRESGECHRAHRIQREAPPLNVGHRVALAVMDFCGRVRAERQARRP
jgi:hypothetical protein